MPDRRGRVVLAMPRLALLLPLIALAAALAGCAPAGDAPSPRSGRAGIVYGTADPAHAAVVALLGKGAEGAFSCTGTIVQVAHGQAYVLTAAHCCGGDSHSPSDHPVVVVMADDFGPYWGALNALTPTPPAYAVTDGSVSWDPLYRPTGDDHDFCMLQFKAPAGTSFIPVPSAGADGLSRGARVEFVGFGATDSNANNSARAHATAPVDQSLTALSLTYSEGGAAHVGGPCNGDSGGPALFPADVSPSAQTVVGITSYGDEDCVAYGVSSRVTSELGPEGFITRYLNDGMDGSSTGSTGASGSSSSSTGTTGSSSSATGSGTTTGGSSTSSATGSIGTGRSDPGGCNSAGGGEVVSFAILAVIFAWRRRRSARQK